MPRQYTPRIACTCKICGTVTMRAPSRTGDFCSVACANEGLRGVTTVAHVCQMCGKVFAARPGAAAKGKGRYCSRACADAARFVSIAVACQQCGQEFTAPPNRIRDGRGKFCSMACKGAYSHAHPRPPADRFWEKVRKTAYCWLWTSGTIGTGYGTFAVTSSVTGEWGSVLAHRFSYELHFGPIPDGLFVCHRCDNPRCVRPDHLFLGDAADNMADMLSKGRHRSQSDPSCQARGERVGTARFTEADIRAMRDRHARGGVTCAEIARDYGTVTATVWGIVKRKSWKHI